MKYAIFLFLFYCQYITAQTELIKYDPSFKYTQQFLDSIMSPSYMNVKIRVSSLKKVLQSDVALKGWTYYHAKILPFVWREGKKDSVEYHAKMGVEVYEKNKIENSIDEKAVARCYYYLGRFNQGENNHVKAIDNFYKGLEFAKKHKDNTLLGYLLSSVADSHSLLGDTNLSKKYYLELSKDSLHNSISDARGKLNSRLAAIYLEENDYLTAKKYFLKTLHDFKEAEYYESMPSVYGNLGLVNEGLGLLDSTIYYYKKAIDASHKYRVRKDLYNKSYIKFYQSYIDIKEGRILEGYRNSEAILNDYSKQLDSIDNYDFDLISKVVSNIGGISPEGERKNKLLDSYVNLTNKYVKTVVNNNIANAEVKYRTKEKEVSISQLEDVTENQKMILQQKSRINWILGVLFLSFLIILLLFFRQRQLKNKYIASNLEQRLLRSQLNPHFLFNALNSVSSLVEDQSVNAIPYISKLGELLRSILQNSREEFISLYEEIETIKVYLELQSDFSQKFQYQFQISEDIDQEIILIPPMFIQPFIENAIQHGFQGADDEKITITIYQNKNDTTLHFGIQDNGIGYLKSMQQKEIKSNHISLSGKILKERLEIYAKMFKSKAFYAIEDLEKGTKINLHLPYILDE